MTLASLVKESSCGSAAAGRADRATEVIGNADQACERSGRESERNRKRKKTIEIAREAAAGNGEREEERPIVRSMREEIGDSISTQMSRGQIFPGSGPWGLGCPWDAASGGSLPNKTGEGESEHQRDGEREREHGRKREK